MSNRTVYARQAIQTRFIAPTNRRPARLKAWCGARARIYTYDHALDVAEDHYQAAIALAAELGWHLDGHGFGSLPGGGYVLVFKAD